MPAHSVVTVLCTVPQDAHAAATASRLGIDAHSEAVALWQETLQARGAPPRQQLVVKYFAAHLKPLCGPGFLLHCGHGISQTLHELMQEARLGSTAKQVRL